MIWTIILLLLLAIWKISKTTKIYGFSKTTRYLKHPVDESNSLLLGLSYYGNSCFKGSQNKWLLTASDQMSMQKPVYEFPPILYHPAKKIRWPKLCQIWQQKMLIIMLGVQSCCAYKTAKVPERSLLHIHRDSR